MFKEVKRRFERLQDGSSVPIYEFRISGLKLLELGQIKRFGIDQDGVQRPLNQTHALNIATAMTDPDHLWLEPIIGALIGDWEYDPSAFILRPVGELDLTNQYISIDDGQHRHEALHCGLLTPEEVAAVAFTAVIYEGLEFRKRLKLFRMQAGRRQIDSNLDLAQRHKLKAWKKPVDGEAYEIVLDLATATDSPLLGIIHLKPGKPGVYKAKDGKKMRMIGATGLHGAIRTLLQRRSMMSTLRPEVRLPLIKGIIQSTAEIWKTNWKNADSSLTSAGGLKALLMLPVTGTWYREQVGGTYTRETMDNALQHAKHFKWHRDRLKNTTPREICERIDQTISRSVTNEATRKRKANRITGPHDQVVTNGQTDDDSTQAT